MSCCTSANFLRAPSTLLASTCKVARVEFSRFNLELMSSSRLVAFSTSTDSALISSLAFLLASLSSCELMSANSSSTCAPPVSLASTSAFLLFSFSILELTLASWDVAFSTPAICVSTLAFLLFNFEIAVSKFAKRFWAFSALATFTSMLAFFRLNLSSCALISSKAFTLLDLKILLKDDAIALAVVLTLALSVSSPLVIPLNTLSSLSVLAILLPMSLSEFPMALTLDLIVEVILLKVSDTFEISGFKLKLDLIRLPKLPINVTIRCTDDWTIL